MANFNQLFLKGFLKLFLAIFTFNLGTILMVLSLSFPMLYYASALMLITSTLFMSREVQRLKWVMDNIEFKDDSPEPQLKINLTDDGMIKVLKLYANGSLKSIMKEFNLTHPQQAQRLLKHSIKQLLEKYVNIHVGGNKTNLVDRS